MTLTKLAERYLLLARKFFVAFIKMLAFGASALLGFGFVWYVLPSDLKNVLIGFCLIAVVVIVSSVMKEINRQPDIAVRSKIFCSNCGTRNTTSRSNCMHCGGAI